MMTNNIDYIRAYTEVNCLLEYLPKLYIDKLPKELIELIKSQSNEQYNININPNKSLLEQNFAKKTKDLIAVMKYNYWSTEEEKKQLEKMFYENEKQNQEELRKKYNMYDIFKRKESINKEENIDVNKLPVKVKNENIFKRLLNRLKKLFSKK